MKVKDLIYVMDVNQKLEVNIFYKEIFKTIFCGIVKEVKCKNHRVILNSRVYLLTTTDLTIIISIDNKMALHLGASK